MLLSFVSLLLFLLVGSDLTFQAQAQNNENRPTSRSSLCINDKPCQTYLCEGNEPCGTSVQCDSNNECTVERTPGTTLQSDLDDGGENNMGDEVEDSTEDLGDEVEDYKKD